MRGIIYLFLQSNNIQLVDFGWDFFRFPVLKMKKQFAALAGLVAKSFDRPRALSDGFSRTADDDNKVEEIERVCSRSLGERREFLFNYVAGGRGRIELKIVVYNLIEIQWRGINQCGGVLMRLITCCLQEEMIEHC